MGVFRPSNIIHYICAITLTISIRILWNLSLEEKSKLHLTNICQPYTGCEINKGRGDCRKIRISCSGSKRCCNDCYLSHIDYIIETKSANIKILDTRRYDFRFTDKLSSPVTACALGCSLIFVFNLVLMILISLEKYYCVAKENTTKRLKTICVFLTHSCFFLIILNTIGFTLFSYGYVIIELRQLLKCQPSFILLISWTMLLTLWFVDFVSDIIPKDYKILNIHRNKNGNKIETVKICFFVIFRLCFVPVQVLAKVIGTICLFWWIK